MALLGARSYTVTRTAGAYVNGIWTDLAVETIRVRGSLQPMSGRDLDQLPEGERTAGQWKLYTETELRTSATGPADTLQARGRALKVMAEIPWPDHTQGVPHRKYRLAEPGEDGR
jgi:hypothetical protein